MMNWYKFFMVLNSCLGSLVVGFLMVTINKGTTYPDEWNLNVTYDTDDNQGFKHNITDHQNQYDNIFIIDSILSAGGFTGSMLTGILSWVYGRRACLILADIIVLLSMIPPLVTKEVTVFASTQFFLGISCGISFSLSYLYVKEICTQKEFEQYRFLPQNFVTLGNLLGGVLWKADPAWEFMLLLPAFFAWIRLVMLHLFFIYDTPFYYLQKQEENEISKAATRKIFDNNEEIKSRLRQTDSLIAADFRIGNLLSNKLWKSTMIGFSLIVMNQTTGVNFYLFFSGIFFQYEHFPQLDFIFVIINFLFSFIPIVLTKFIKKKHLLVAGLGITNFLIVIAHILSRYFDLKGVGIVYVIFLITFYLVFECSLAGLLLSIIAEILPDIGTILMMGIHWIILSMITLSFQPNIKYFQFIAISFSIVNTVVYVVLVYFYEDDSKEFGKNDSECENTLALNSS